MSLAMGLGEGRDCARALVCLYTILNYVASDADQDIDAACVNIFTPQDRVQEIAFSSRRHISQRAHNIHHVNV